MPVVLYFLRHAEAEDHAESDAARRLTPRGLAQAAKAAKFLCRAGIQPDVVLTSPLVRARQTADVVSGALDRSPIVSDWLACGMSPKTFVKGIGAQPGFESVLLVGHEPDFSTVIGWLIGAAALGIKVRKSSLTAVDAPSLDAGAGQLQFLVPARLM